MSVPPPPPGRPGCTQGCVHGRARPVRTRCSDRIRPFFRPFLPLPAPSVPSVRSVPSVLSVPSAHASAALLRRGFPTVAPRRVRRRELRLPGQGFARAMEGVRRTADRTRRRSPSSRKRGAVDIGIGDGVSRTGSVYVVTAVAVEDARHVLGALDVLRISGGDGGNAGDQGDGAGARGRLGVSSSCRPRTRLPPSSAVSVASASLAPTGRSRERRRATRRLRHGIRSLSSCRRVAG